MGWGVVGRGGAWFLTISSSQSFRCGQVVVRSCVSVVREAKAARPSRRHNGSHVQGKVPAWEKDVLQLNEKFGLKSGATPWSSRAGVTLGGLSLQSRNVSMANTVWASSCVQFGEPFHTESDQVASDLFCDFSQNLSRGTYGKSSSIAVGQNSLIYSFKVDRVLLHAELLRALGYDGTLPDLGGLCDLDITSCVGEGISLPCLALVMYSCLLSFPPPRFWRNGENR